MAAEPVPMVVSLVVEVKLEKGAGVGRCGEATDSVAIQSGNATHIWKHRGMSE